MRREDLLDLIGRIPEVDHPKLQLVLRSGLAITTDTFVRFEEHYLALRGREAGQTDDSRAFFVPYDEVLCLKIEKVVQLSDFTAIYGEDPPTVAQPQSPSAASAQTPSPAPAATPAPSAPVDPTEIARQNLLARIRATRTSVAGGRQPVTPK